MQIHTGTIGKIKRGGRIMLASFSMKKEELIFKYI